MIMLNMEDIEKIQHIYTHISKAKIYELTSLYSDLTDFSKALEELEASEAEFLELCKKCAQINNEKTKSLLHRYIDGLITYNMTILGLRDIEEQQEENETRAELLADYYACIM